MADASTNPENKSPTFGGCEGPDAMFVKLISSDGHEFVIRREHALTSGTIKAMLSGPGGRGGTVQVGGAGQDRWEG